MRAGKRKTLKRGRKSKRGILKAKKDNTKVSKKSKGEGMAGKKGTRKAAGNDKGTRKAAGTKAKLADSTESTFEQEAAKSIRKRARTPKQEVADAAEPKKPRGKKAKAENEGCVKQDRVGAGKNWRYKVMEGQRFGCTNCRFIYNGCKNCQKKAFRGRSAQQVWEEEDSMQEEYYAEPVAPAAKAPSKRKGKKSKKA